VLEAAVAAAVVVVVEVEEVCWKWMPEYLRIAELGDRSCSHRHEDFRARGDGDVARPTPTRCAIARSLLVLGDNTQHRAAIEHFQHALPHGLGLGF
jgi:hypothetical protein